LSYSFSSAVDPQIPTEKAFGGGRSITVGLGGEYRTLSAAVAAAQPHDLIEIGDGTYYDDTCIIEQPLTIAGTGGAPLLLSTDLVRNGKAILITRNDVTLRNLAFRGATAVLGNGAGIRHEAGVLRVDDCVFRNNQNGILAAHNPTAKVHINNCRFIGNGAGDGHTHGVYAADEIAALTINDSIFVGTFVGHHIKSRARHTTVTGNVIGDGITGTSSYDIEFPDGGIACLLGNRVFHGATSQNRTSVCYGAESMSYDANHLEIRDNHFENRRRYFSVGILNYSRSISGDIRNNHFKGFLAHYLGWPLWGKRPAIMSSDRSTNSIRPMLPK
jgi:nitrous oxidase accessory protein NosD